MLGDNYLVIRKWMSNFVPEEDTITKLTTMVRIPRLGMEHLNKNLLFHKIGTKIENVIRVYHS